MNLKIRKNTQTDNTLILHFFVSVNEIRATYNNGFSMHNLIDTNICEEYKTYEFSTFVMFEGENATDESAKSRVPSGLSEWVICTCEIDYIARICLSSPLLANPTHSFPFKIASYLQLSNVMQSIRTTYGQTRCQTVENVRFGLLLIERMSESS